MKDSHSNVSEGVNEKRPDKKVNEKEPDQTLSKQDTQIAQNSAQIENTVETPHELSKENVKTVSYSRSLLI